MEPTAPKSPVTAGDGLQVFTGEAKVPLHLHRWTKKTLLSKNQKQNHRSNQSRSFQMINPVYFMVFKVFMAAAAIVYSSTKQLSV